MPFKKSTKKLLKNNDVPQDDSAEEDVNIDDEDLLEALTVRLEKFTSKLSKNVQGEKTLKNKISKDPVSAIFQLLISIQDSVENINSKFDNLSHRVTLLEDEVKSTKLRESEQIKINKQLEDYIENLEKKSRERQAVLSSSLLDTTEQNFIEKTRERITNELGATQGRAEGIEVNKLGKNKSVVLLSFPTIECKQDFFRRIKHRRTILGHQDNAPPIYMNDFLTPKTAKLFKDVRKLKDDSGKIFSVFTFRSSVYVKIKKEDDMVLVRNVDDVKTLILT